MSRSRSWMLAALSAVVLFHCRRHAPEAAPRQDAAAENASVAAPSSSSPPAASAARSAVAPKVLSPVETKAYQAALERGRRATLEKQWAAACAAFDQALAILPDDPRAQAERGYARMLSDDLDGAAKDLQAAQGHSSDNKLEAQIWFNIGLVADKRGDAEGSRAAFARSFQLNPTSAAQARLEGKSRCIVGTDRKVVPPKNFPSWRAVWDALASSSGSPPPATEVASRSALGVTSCPTACIVENSTEASFHLLMPRSDGSIDVHAKIGEGGSYRCGGPPGITIVDGSDPLHVIVANELGETGVSCFQEQGQQTCRMICTERVSWYRHDMFFDPRSHVRMLRLSQTGSSRQEGTATERTRAPKVDAEGVEFSGAGCKDTRVKFKP